MSGLANQATNWLVADHSPQRMGSAHPNIAPYGTPYPTADDTAIVLVVSTDRQFAALCDVLQVPDLAEHPDFSIDEVRIPHRDALDQASTPRIETFECEALLRALHDRNCWPAACGTSPRCSNNRPRRG
ncbi:MAG: CoA transferase [Salinibacter sp.]